MIPQVFVEPSTSSLHQVQQWKQSFVAPHERLSFNRVKSQRAKQMSKEINVDHRRKLKQYLVADDSGPSRKWMGVFPTLHEAIHWIRVEQDICPGWSTNNITIILMQTDDIIHHICDDKTEQSWRFVKGTWTFHNKGRRDLTSVFVHPLEEIIVNGQAYRLQPID